MANCTMDGAAPYNCEGCDLRALQLRNKDLKKANFKKANLSGLDLSGLDLSGADLSEAILGQTTLNKTILKNAVLFNTNFCTTSGMAEADLSGAKMGNGTDFSGLDLSTTLFGDALKSGQGEQLINLSNAKIPFAVLGKAWRGLNLTGTQIAGLPQDLSRLSVKKCKLDNFNFSKMKLVGALFEASSLQEAKFNECTLSNANFVRSTSLAAADFSSANLALAVLDGANLGRTNFKNAVLTGCSFRYAKMDGTIFESTNVSEAMFSNPPLFSRDINKLTSFKDATLNASMLNKEWSFLDLRAATLLGLDPRTDFSNLRAEGANLSGHNFTSYTLNDANFSRASLDACIFDDAKLSRANFRGAKGKSVSFRRSVLFNANFSSIGSNGEQPSIFPGVDFSAAVLTKAGFAFAKMGPVPDERDAKKKKPSRFVGARMEDMGLNQADLSGAIITGSVLLHSSNLTSAILQEANLTGVQMGAYATFFSLYENSEKANYMAFLADLNSGTRDQIKRMFKEKTGADVLDKPEVTVTAPNYAWTIKDGTAIFTVIRWVADDQTVALVVSKAAVAAKLSNADLRNVVLRDADLREVTAHGAYLYGPETKLSGTKLDGIKLLDAHMQDIDLSGAKLYGADLTRANLIGANFQRAVLQKVILGSAWLQGAKFLDTDLNGVALEGACLSVHMPSGKAGVYLLALDPATSTDPKFPAEFQRLTAEIERLSRQYVIKDKDAKLLDAGDLQSLSFTGANTLKFSRKATVMSHQDGWIIDDDGEKYYAWLAEDEKGNDLIYIRTAEAPSLTRLFKRLNLKLREHFSIRSLSGSEWELDNDAEKNPQEGHAVFRFIKSGTGVLFIYATASRMKEKDEDRGTPKLITGTYMATVLCSNGATANCDPYNASTVFGPETICPNARRLRENERDNISWLDMLRPV